MILPIASQGGRSEERLSIRFLTSRAWLVNVLKDFKHWLRKEYQSQVHDVEPRSAFPPEDMVRVSSP